ncbi:hypothetical protein [Halosimplex amylolyticum]
MSSSTRWPLHPVSGLFDVHWKTLATLVDGVAKSVGFFVAQDVCEFQQ